MHSHRAALTATILLGLCGAAWAEPPRCSDPELLKTFTDDVVHAINFNINAVLALSRKVSTSQYEAKVDRMYETAATAAQRSCSGFLVISGDGHSAQMPVQYTLISTEDGQKLYQWDAPEHYIDSLFDWLPKPQSRDFTAEETTKAGPNVADMMKSIMKSDPNFNAAFDRSGGVARQS